MSIEPECPVLGCKEGPGDAKWKSPLLLYEQAYNELDRHLLYNYPLTRNSNRYLSEYCSPNTNLNKYDLETRRHTQTHTDTHRHTQTHTDT